MTFDKRYDAQLLCQTDTKCYSDMKDKETLAYRPKVKYDH